MVATVTISKEKKTIGKKGDKYSLITFLER